MQKTFKNAKKFRGDETSLPKLIVRETYILNKGFSTPKWIEFSRLMLMNEYRVWVYEAARTYSKYISVLNPYNGKKYRVRFSNHKSNEVRENENNCDFFVGRNHNSVSTTADAIGATRKALGEVPQT